MTINNDYFPVVYPSQGVGPYEFTFSAIREEDVVVTLDEVVVNPADYTIGLNGSDPIFTGGSVTFNSDPGGNEIVISRFTSRDQNVDYQRYGAFPAETHEFALDKLTMMIQELLFEVQSGGGTAPPSDTYLPLAGGQMNQGAEISWPSAGGEIGDFTFGTVLGQPSFLWAPGDTVAGEIGFSFGAANGKILGYNSDSRFRLSLLGYNTLQFSELLDGDVILKADTTDMEVMSTTYKHQTDEATFGVMTMTYEATNLAGIAGGQAIVFDNDKTNIYSGYKFVTGATDGSEYTVEIAGGGVWTSRPQTGDGGANAPLPDQLVTRGWVETHGPGAGTVGEAPQDGQEYVRKNAMWVVGSGGIPDAPADGNTYGRNNNAWVNISSGAGFNPAGDTWLLDAVQTFTAAVNFNGEHTYGNVFGTDTFQWRPSDPATETVGYNWQANNSVALSFTATGGLRASNVPINDDTCFITRGYANTNYSQPGHTHEASDVVSGVFNIARIPTGTSGSTVALGNHNHSGVYAEVGDIPPGWSQDKASGAWQSTGASLGTQRGASTPTKLGVGSYRINLTSPLTNTANASVAITPYGAIVPIGFVMSVLNNTQIQVNTVNTNTGDPIDVGCTYRVSDRGIV